MATEDLGDVIVCNLVRREDDTDDITVRLRDSSGNLVDTTNFTANLRVSATADGTPLATFAGAAPVSPTQPNGLIVIDMASFAITPGSYKYDIRITDGNPADNPARVYFAGGLKVRDRIQ